MTPDGIRKARNSLGLTQEQFAVKMLVDVTTVQRWESGSTEPSLLVAQRLRNSIAKRPGLDHPLIDLALDMETGVAILDENAVYRRVNGTFLKHIHSDDSSDMVGSYCRDANARLHKVWQSFGELTGMAPEDLLFGDFNQVSVRENHSENGTPTAFVHTIAAIRQTDFSSYLLHKIEQSRPEDAG